MVPPTSSKAAASVLIGLCALAALASLGLVRDDDGDRGSLAPQFAADDDSLLTPREQTRRGQGRRRLRHRPRHARRRRRAAEAKLPREESSLSGASPSGVYLWAERHLAPVAVPPVRPPEGDDDGNGREEVPLFWHIPKSGGTTAEDVYQCLGQTISNRVGSLPQFGHDKDTQLLTFQPWWEKWGNTATYINTDTTTPAGILRAKELGLVSSGMVDVIFSGNPAFAVEHLYDEMHRGRAMALFRHPVDRLVSKFYYLQVADWERTYAPQWKKLSIRKWATKVNRDNNFMVRKLAGKNMYQTVDEADLQRAIKTVEERFVVGLMENMEEGIRRFNVVLGIDESTQENRECLDKFFGDHVEKKNSNSHPKLAEGDREWTLLAEKNSLDVRLYERIRLLYEEQASVIQSYEQSTSAVSLA